MTDEEGQMEIRLAQRKDLNGIMALIRSCVRQMESEGILQWDELYPDEATFRRDIERHELFVLDDGGRISGVVALNEHEEPEYRTVGWNWSGSALVVHRLAVEPSSWGRGHARALMRFAHGVARERQYATIRLDAFSGNPRAVALYERLGYRRAGSVRFRKGEFICFELPVEQGAMEIRSARQEDAGRIAGLLTQLGYPGTERFIRSKIEALLRHPDAELAVAVENDLVLGIISVHFIPQIALAGDFARISYLCVDESARSSGVGRLLEAWCERVARERGCDRIELHCHSRREAAHRFYSRQGYEESPKYLMKKI